MRQSGIILKQDSEIELMRRAGRVVHQVLSRMRELAVPGATTAQLNAVAEQMIADVGGVALFKGVRTPQARIPFPAALCTSVNEELVHGIPSGRVLAAGDIVSIDCGVKLAGYCGDSAITVKVGEVSPEVDRLMAVTRGALDLAIQGIRPGRMWSEIARQMQAYVEAEGFSVVREFVGHGIGREMHEEPKVPNYWSARQRAMDFELTANMVIAVEPMVNIGGPEVEIADPQGWVVSTKDRSFAAHYEHTIAVTATGVDVLTDGH